MRTASDCRAARTVLYGFANSGVRTASGCRAARAVLYGFANSGVRRAHAWHCVSASDGAGRWGQALRPRGLAFAQRVTPAWHRVSPLQTMARAASMSTASRARECAERAGRLASCPPLCLCEIDRSGRSGQRLREPGCALGGALNPDGSDGYLLADGSTPMAQPRWLRWLNPDGSNIRLVFQCLHVAPRPRPRVRGGILRKWQPPPTRPVAT